MPKMKTHSGAKKRFKVTGSGDSRSVAVPSWRPDVYGKAEAKVWAQRWRMFWMACAELFGYAGGNEWLVAHYRFQKR